MGERVGWLVLLLGCLLTAVLLSMLLRWMGMR